MKNLIYLSESILDWDFYSGGGKVVSKDDLLRPYEIWEHSRKLVEKAGSEFDLADGISSVKRALNSRLQIIEKYYQLRDIDPSWKRKHYFEILESFDLLRPYLMKNLLELRNDIEHNDAVPPSKERCSEFIDIVWYFLKSTDPVIQTIKDSNAYKLYDKDGRETNYGFSISVNYSNLNNIEICGWFYKDIISTTYREGCLTIQYKDIHTKKKWKNNSYHESKLETDKWINGSLINLSTETKKKIITQILSAL